MEGFGIVYLEAAASALPIIASTASGIAEQVQKRDVGLLVPPDDPDALADALVHLLRDNSLRQRMGRTGRRWVKREMTWEQTARHIEALLEALQ